MNKSQEVKSMKMNFVGRHMKVFEVIKEMAEKKLSKFDKFFHDDAEMEVTFSMPKNAEKVEITIYTDGTTFRAEEISDTFANAIDRAIDSLERQIRKNKTRLHKKIREAEEGLVEEIRQALHGGVELHFLSVDVEVGVPAAFCHKRALGRDIAVAIGAGLFE